MHVGLPKTGTTALQRSFRENRQQLLAAGISYPELFGAHDDKHSFLVSEMRYDPSLPQIHNVISNPETETILLSNEGLSNHFYDFPQQALARFRELTQGIDVKISMVIRQKEDWLKSYHKQCVLNPNNGASELWGTSLRVEEISNHYRITQLLDHDQLLADMIDGYGAGSAVQLRYEDPDWISDVWEGLGFGRAPVATLTSINESLPGWSIEMMRQINAIVPGMENRRIWLNALQQFLQSNHTIMTEVVQIKDPAEVSHLNREILGQIKFNIPGIDEETASKYAKEFSKFANYLQLKQ